MLCALIARKTDHSHTAQAEKCFSEAHVLRKNGFHFISPAAAGETLRGTFLLFFRGKERGEFSGQGAEHVADAYVEFALFPISL